MRLGRRILDLVQAVVRAAPRSLTAGPHAGEDSEPHRIEDALARAEVRRRRLEENLAAAEQAGNELEARHAQRQIDELARSAEGLRQTLEVMAARREVAGPSSPDAAPAVSDVSRPGLSEPETAAGDATPAGDADLEALKRRLSGPV